MVQGAWLYPLGGTSRSQARWGTSWYTKQQVQTSPRQKKVSIITGYLQVQPVNKAEQVGRIGCGAWQTRGDSEVRCKDALLSRFGARPCLEIAWSCRAQPQSKGSPHSPLPRLLPMFLSHVQSANCLFSFPCPAPHILLCLLGASFQNSS